MNALAFGLSFCLAASSCRRLEKELDLGGHGCEYESLPFFILVLCALQGVGDSNPGRRDGRHTASQPTTGGLRVHAQVITLLLLHRIVCLGLGKFCIQLQIPRATEES